MKAKASDTEVQVEQETLLEKRRREQLRRRAANRSLARRLDRAGNGRTGGSIVWWRAGAFAITLAAGLAEIGSLAGVGGALAGACLGGALVAGLGLIAWLDERHMRSQSASPPTSPPAE